MRNLKSCLVVSSDVAHEQSIQKGPRAVSQRRYVDFPGERICLPLTTVWSANASDFVVNTWNIATSTIKSGSTNRDLEGFQSSAATVLEDIDACHLY